MRWSIRTGVLALAVAVGTFTPGNLQGLAQQHDASQHSTGTHTHGEAAKLKNPVARTAASLATGKKLYATSCASCHGETGKGDGKSAPTLDPKPSDLTDASWKHGPSDGEIFTLIRDGARQTSMRGYAGKMTSQEIWSVVNFVRSLRQPTAKSQ